MKQVVRGVAAIVLSLGMAVQTKADITSYHNLSDFLAALASDPAPWTNIFTDDGFEPSPVTFTHPPFGYVASTPGGFFSMAPNQFSTNSPFDPITFTFTSRSSSAAGGNFWLTDLNFGVITGNQTVTVVDGDGAELSVTLTDANPTTFLGFVSDEYLVSVTLTPDPNNPQLARATVASFVVGAAVPELSTLALLATGVLGVVAYGWRCRK